MNPWNVYPKMSTFSINHLHNYCWNFQILPDILPAKKKETTEYDCHYQMQHIFEAKKVFKYINEWVFHRTQLMAMHNTVMSSNTNVVPPSETPMLTTAWCYSLVLICAVAAGPSDALPANQTWPLPCSHGTHQHEAITSRSHLLMMGTRLPETCWATIRREIKNTKSDI